MQVVIPSLVAASGVVILVVGLRKQNNYLDSQVLTSFPALQVIALTRTLIRCAVINHTLKIALYENREAAFQARIARGEVPADMLAPYEEMRTEWRRIHRFPAISRHYVPPAPSADSATTGAAKST